MGNENHLCTRQLNKVLIIARQSRIWHRMVMWYNIYINTRLQRNVLCKALYGDVIGQDEWLRKSLVNIPTHPPSIAMKKKLKDLASEKRKFCKVNSLHILFFFVKLVTILRFIFKVQQRICLCKYLLHGGNRFISNDFDCIRKCQISMENCVQCGLQCAIEYCCPHH